MKSHHEKPILENCIHCKIREFQKKKSVNFSVETFHHFTFYAYTLVIRGKVKRNNN